MKKHKISSIYYSSDAGEHRGVLQKIGWSDQKEDPELNLFKKIVLEKGKVATCELIRPVFQSYSPKLP